jgi:dTDP-4-dehydrorhamnose reductase
MKILLTGKDGQLGFELQRALRPLGEIIAVNRQQCDLAKPDSIRSIIQSVKPDLIINSAAYTSVDLAETEISLAKAINADAPGIIGEEASKLGASVIHYSTDYVFDGTKLDPYIETDLTNPHSIYGKTKRDGESALLASCPKTLIFRSSWIVGMHGRNFAKTILRLAEEKETLNVISDQFGSPTSAILISDVTAKIVGETKISNLENIPYGLYHLVASGETTWYEYARFVVGKAIESGKNIKLLPDNIKPISSLDYPQPAKRPRNSRMDTQHFQKTFMLELPDWKLGVNKILQGIL